MLRPVGLGEAQRLGVGDLAGDPDDRVAAPRTRCDQRDPGVAVGGRGQHALPAGAERDGEVAGGRGQRVGAEQGVRPRAAGPDQRHAALARGVADGQGRGRRAGEPDRERPRRAGGADRDRRGGRRGVGVLLDDHRREAGPGEVAQVSGGHERVGLPDLVLQADRDEDRHGDGARPPEAGACARRDRDREQRQRGGEVAPGGPAVAVQGQLDDGRQAGEGQRHRGGEPQQVPGIPPPARAPGDGQADQDQHRVRADQGDQGRLRERPQVQTEQGRGGLPGVARQRGGGRGKRPTSGPTSALKRSTAPPGP